MSATLTPEDLERLRVRLSALPGFDPVGLFVYDEGDKQRLVVATDGTSVWASEGHHAPHPPHLSMWAVAYGDVYVSAFDASTRDRLARYVMAFRLHLGAESTTAPSWDWSGSPDLPAFVLSCQRAIGSIVFVAREDSRWREEGLRPVVVVPTLAGLRGESGWPEWAALAAVAVHLGGQP